MLVISMSGWGSVLSLNLRVSSAPAREDRLWERDDALRGQALQPPDVAAVGEPGEAVRGCCEKLFSQSGSRVALQQHSQ